MKIRIGVACLVVLLAAGSLISCGGGGGGGGAPLLPPAYNMTGRWSVDMVTGAGSCPVASNTHWPFQVDVIHASGSNTVYILDTRDVGGTPGQATLSGNTMSYSGGVYPEGACTDATASIVVTVTSSTHFSGSGTYNCLSGGGCAVSVSYTGNK